MIKLSDISLRDYKTVRSIHSYLPNKMLLPRRATLVLRLLEMQDEGVDINHILRARLVRILKLALEYVPHYKNLRLDVKTNDINENNAIEVLKKFPFLQKSTIMKNPRSFVPSFFIKAKMDSMTKIRNVSVPKLFIHSLEDEIVHLALGKKLYEAASVPKDFLGIQGDHNEGFMASWETYRNGIQHFLKKYNLI